MCSTTLKNKKEFEKLKKDISELEQPYKEQLKDIEETQVKEQINFDLAQQKVKEND